MIFYIDSDYKCFTEEAEGLTAIESAFFDNKCKEYIEGFRYVPTGHEWVREDGEVFQGEMISAFVEYSELAMAQLDADIAEMQDMQTALNELGVSVDG